MKFLIVTFSVFCCMAYCHAKEKVTGYRNNEKHIAKEVDVNNVPVDPACKFKTVWENVRLRNVYTTSIPTNNLKYVTIVKFHYAGAWIAWTDEKGYHEPLLVKHIAWTCFPEEIRKYYEKYTLPDWNEVKVKKAFSLRTAQINPVLKRYKDKTGKHIERRSVNGVVCRSLLRSVYFPYSELPLDMRTQCGYYENESYIQSMPVLDKKIPSLSDNILFIQPYGFRIIRRMKDGFVASVSLSRHTRGNYKKIFVQNFKGRLVPNHRSDLHIFEMNGSEKRCENCKLSDHLTERFYNYMFDRQSRTPCSVTKMEYAFVKKGTKKIGNETLNSYVFIPDFDKKYPKDSVRMLGNKKIPQRKAE